MTTTTQQTVLTADELTCLRDCAEGRGADYLVLQALAAKGLLQQETGGYALTPAGHHTLHQGEPGVVPGIDT